MEFPRRVSGQSGMGSLGVEWGGAADRQIVGKLEGVQLWVDCWQDGVSLLEPFLQALHNYGCEGNRSVVVEFQRAVASWGWELWWTFSSWTVHLLSWRLTSSTVEGDGSSGSDGGRALRSFSHSAEKSCLSKRAFVFMLGNSFSSLSLHISFAPSTSFIYTAIFFFAILFNPVPPSEGFVFLFKALFYLGGDPRFGVGKFPYGFDGDARADAKVQ